MFGRHSNTVNEAGWRRGRVGKVLLSRKSIRTFLPGARVVEEGVKGRLMVVGTISSCFNAARHFKSLLYFSGLFFRPSKADFSSLRDRGTRVKWKLCNFVNNILSM